MASPGHLPPPPSERGAIACPTSSGWNPYLDLLYGALEREGVPFEPDARLTAGWLVGARRRVRWLHIHWPQSLYRFSRGPYGCSGGRSPGSSWAFSPHGSRLRERSGTGWSGRSTRFSRTKARAASTSLPRTCSRGARTCSSPTTRRPLRALPRSSARGQVAVVPHGSVRRRLPARGREGGDESRSRGSATSGSHSPSASIRRYKDVDGSLLDAFGRVQAGGLLLVVGYPKDARLAAELLARRRSGTPVSVFSPDSSVTSAWPTSSPRLMSRSCRAGTEAHRAP